MLLIAGPPVLFIGGAILPFVQDLGLAAIAVGFAWCGYALFTEKIVLPQRIPHAGTPQPTA